MEERLEEEGPVSGLPVLGPEVAVPGGLPHGTVNGYRRRGCRCEPCVTAHDEYRKRQSLMWKYKKEGGVKPTMTQVEGPPDWSLVEHIKPGMRRARG